MSRVFLLPRDTTTDLQIRNLFKDNLAAISTDYDQLYRIVQLKEPATERELMLINLLYEPREYRP